eukprot:TRINITY_DN28720_c0_g1_i1.p1 TRINITY_DN28720_c0_g1~~TRINITY_DN28720_c0_g1_i1.p1  ORF type:complete len:551 (-),score=89.21 TRINITY_DN28720_c0_g1_i1:43-1572(-)
MNVYMKWLFSPDGGDFALPWTMLAVQQAEAYLVLQPMLAYMDTTGRFGWGIGKARSGQHEALPLAQDSADTAVDAVGFVEMMQVLAVTGFFCINVGLNSLSLVRISITLNQTVRACLPVGVLVFASCVEQRTYPGHSYVTTAVLVAGVALTCWGSPDFEVLGFSLALTSTLVAAIGTSLNGRLLSSGSFKGTGADRIMRLMMLQSVPAFVFFTVTAAFTEGQQVMQLLVPNEDDAAARRPWLPLLGLVSISSALALVSNLGRCFLVASTSALMETFAGNAKVAALCIIDNVFFGTALYGYNYFGIVVTFLAFSAHVLMQYISASNEAAESEAARKADKPPNGEKEDFWAVKRARGPALSLCISGAETGLAAEHVALHLGRTLPRSHRRRRRAAHLAEGEEEAHTPSRPRAETWAAGEATPGSAKSWLGKLGEDLNPVLEAPGWLSRSESFSSQFSDAATPPGRVGFLLPIEERQDRIASRSDQDSVKSVTPLTGTDQVSRNRFFTDNVT